MWGLEGLGMLLTNYPENFMKGIQLSSFLVLVQSIIKHLGLVKSTSTTYSFCLQIKIKCAVVFFTPSIIPTGVEFYDLLVVVLMLNCN